MVEETLFHVCDRAYSPGETKPAGSYWAGLVLAGHSALNDPDGEFVREEIRSANYAHLPSRANSSFVFETMADAQFFRDNFKPKASIYEVRFVDPSAPRHRVTWSAFQTASPIPCSIQAHEFWSGVLLYSSNIEIFAESDLLFL